VVGFGGEELTLTGVFPMLALVVDEGLGRYVLEVFVFSLMLSADEFSDVFAPLLFVSVVLDLPVEFVLVALGEGCFFGNVVVITALFVLKFGVCLVKPIFIVEDAGINETDSRIAKTASFGLEPPK